MRYSPSRDPIPALQYSQELHPGTFAIPKRGCLILEADVGSRSSNGEEETKVSAPYGKLHGTPITPLKVRKKVTFQRVEIRQYERQPGDNPSVSRGVPIGLGWKVVKTESYRFDEFEGQIGVTRERRQKKQLLLSEEDRERLLHEEWGYSFKQLFEARVSSSDAKKRRIQTLTRSTNTRLAKFDESLSLASALIIDGLLRPSKQEVKKLWTETEARNILLEKMDPKRYGGRRKSDPNISSWNLTHSDKAMQQNFVDDQSGKEEISSSTTENSTTLRRNSSVPFFFHSSFRKHTEMDGKYNGSVVPNTVAGSPGPISNCSAEANDKTVQHGRQIRSKISRTVSSPSFTNFFKLKRVEAKTKGNEGPESSNRTPRRVEAKIKDSEVPESTNRISRSISSPSLMNFSKHKPKQPGCQDSLSSTQYGPTSTRKSMNANRSVGLVAIIEEEYPQSLTF